MESSQIRDSPHCRYPETIAAACGSLQMSSRFLLPRIHGDVVALQPDDRETDRGDVRPQQPRRGLSHHVCLVIVPGVGEHCDLLDRSLRPCGVSINIPIAGLPLWNDGDLIGSPNSVAVPELVSGGD
jgi:hypothetical protein